jgi:hypothetical protein
MKKIFRLLLALLFPLGAAAQDDCFKTLYHEGKTACERRAFNTACTRLIAARACSDLPRRTDLEEWITRARHGRDERIAWNTALQSDTREGWEAFLHDFPEGYYRTRAEDRLARLIPIEARPIIQNTLEGVVNWTREYVEATGEAILNREKWPQEDQAIRTATQSAEAIAKSRLLEVISGLHIRRQTIVRDLMGGDDEVKTYVSGIIQSARTFGEAQVSKTTVSVTLRVPMFGPGGVAGVVFSSSSEGMSDTTDIPDAEPFEWTLVLPKGTVPQFAIFAVFTNAENALLLDGSGIADAGVAPLARWYRARSSDFFTGENVFEAQLSAVGHIMLPKAAEPVFQEWLQLRKIGGAALPVRVVVR